MVTDGISSTEFKRLPGHGQVKEITENDPYYPNGGGNVHQSFPERFIGEFVPFSGKEVGEVKESGHFYDSEYHPNYIHTSAEEYQTNCYQRD